MSSWQARGVIQASPPAGLSRRSEKDAQATRSEGRRLYLDCYNANPDSMERSLDFFESLSWGGRRIAVLGGMRELGVQTAPAHAELGERLRATGLDLVFLVGAEMEHAWKSAQGGASVSHISWGASVDALGQLLHSLVRPGDIVLLKGSRGLELERLLPRLAKRDSTRGGRC